MSYKVSKDYPRLKQLLFDSQHNENIEYRVKLHDFNAYDDKGNKIQGDCVRFVKKEYDK